MYVTHVLCLCLCRNHKLEQYIGERLDWAWKLVEIIIQCWKWLAFVLCIVFVICVTQSICHAIFPSFIFFPFLDSNNSVEKFLENSSFYRSHRMELPSQSDCHFLETANNNCICFKKPTFNHRPAPGSCSIRKSDIETWFGWWLLVEVKIMISHVG